MRLKIVLPWRRRLGRKASAAVEFAIVAPVLLLLLIGTAEILLLYRTEAKLNALAGNMAQMVSLQTPTNTSKNATTGVTYYPVQAGTSTTTASLGDLCKGARYGLQPLPAAGLSVAIASVTEHSAAVAGTKTTPAQSATYDYWEADKNCTNSAGAATTATTIGSSAACALALDSSGGSMVLSVGDNIIIARATLTYPGMVGLVLGSSPTLTQTAYARWRIASKTNELTCVASGTDCVSSNPPTAVPCS